MFAREGSHATVWRVRQELPQAQDLQRALGCSDVLARLLAARDITGEDEARAFLSPSFESLADPALLPDSVPAIRRIIRALDQRERIYVYGDYDGDGITAAALWTRLLERLGGEVHVHVPHRRRDGYDLRNHVVDAACEIGARVIITADCGVQRHCEVAAAREAGVDVIVTDHHEPGPTLPPALAVVNPHRHDSKYPFRDLAGVGVSFRLGEALVRAIGLAVEKYRRAFSELAAIGTVTDIMPLLGDNRVFVKAGLGSISETHRRGLRALLRLTGLDGKAVTSQDIGFVLGPRLNAVGRMDDPRKALDLLLTRVDEQATELAAELEQANRDRREEEQRILEAAVQRILAHNQQSAPCVVLDADDWHPGVIGIVANRIVERFGRPTVLIAHDTETGLGRGSARSIPCFNIHRALEESADLLIEFGGHAHAAGFTIASEDVDPLRERLTALASRWLEGQDLRPVLELDAELSPHRVTRELVQELALLEPYGHDNEEPVFGAFGVKVRDMRRMGRDRSHLRLWVAVGLERPVEAVLWGGGEWADILPQDASVDIAFKARMHAFNGIETPRLQIVDMRPSRGS